MLKSEASPRININIVRPEVLKVEQKSRSSETVFPSNFKTPIKSPITRRSSVNISSEPPPPPPDPFAHVHEIQALNKSKEYMNKLLQQLNQVVKENDATPEVQTKLSPLVENVAQSFPTFHTQAIKYYQSYYQIQETTKTHQVLSTASVKIPLTAFTKAWDDLEKVIDIYADRHPPPHAKEISGKFDAIKSSLEIILQTNANRKFPNPGLGKSVLSIQSLCDSITNAVYELFMQERFPNFEIDSLSMYKADVKSFLRVITDAFYNEFPQSGVALCDLARIKLNVVASCNEIIEALKAAFVFPNSLKSVQKLKNSFNDETKEIIETLQQQFNVVKPKNGNEIQYNVAPVKKTKEEETLEKIAADDVEGRLKNMEPSRKVELFLHDTLPFFNKNLTDFGDCWDALFYMSNQMKGFVKKYEVNDDSITDLKMKIHEMKKDVKDAHEFARKKTQVANEIDELRKKESSDNLREVESLKAQISSLKNLINEKQEEMENIVRENEVGRLRDGMEKIAQSINSHLKTPVSLNFEELTHEELTNLILKIDSKVFQEQSTSNKNDQNNNTNDENDTNNNSASNKEEQSDNKNTPDTQPQDEPKIEIDIVDIENKEKEHQIPEPPQSPNLHNTHSTNSSSHFVPRRGEEVDKISEELVSSREGHFSDLKLVISKLDGLIACQYDSAHKEILKNNDEKALLEDPVNSRIELNGLISDQFQALQKLFRALLNNDKENQKTIRELTMLINRFKTELGTALGIEEEEPTKLLSLAVNIITDKQNPLNDKIIELSDELRKRDSQEMKVTSRLTAICKQQSNLFLTSQSNSDLTEDEKATTLKTINSNLYYEIKKNNTNANMMKLLRVIQDKFDEKTELVTTLEKKTNLMQNFLYEIEMRLRNATKKSESDLGSQNQEKDGFEDLNDDFDKVNFLIERIQNLCDIVVSPRFSDEFVKSTDLNKMFSNIPHDENKHPTEFIPQVCEKYLTMQSTINSTKPFLGILDEIFQGIDDQGKTLKDNNLNKDSLTSTINEQQFQLLQSQVSRFHQALRSTNGATSNSPVSRLTSRFVALVQALIDRQAI